MTQTQQTKTKVLIFGAGTEGSVTKVRCGLLGHDAAVFVQRIKGLLEQPATFWRG